MLAILCVLKRLSLRDAQRPAGYRSPVCEDFRGGTHAVPVALGVDTGFRFTLEAFGGPVRGVHFETTIRAPRWVLGDRDMATSPGFALAPADWRGP